MLKMLSMSAALCLAVVSGAAAQMTDAPDGPVAARARHRQVEANGRCEGLSYGTGARRCGTRTGGPVGGISGRN